MIKEGQNYILVFFFYKNDYRNMKRKKNIYEKRL